MKEAERAIEAHLKALGIEPGAIYAKLDESFQPTGEYFVSCDAGLFVGRVSEGENDNLMLDGHLIQWGRGRQGRLSGAR